MALLTALLSRVELLVFDFDGTLVDSNDIKRAGFEHVFQAFPAQRAEIMAYCRGSNHTIRREKFRHVYEDILRLPYTPEVDRSLHERYAAVTTAAVINAPEIPGASAFLKKVSGLYQTAVLSSTPDAILKEILDARGWTGYFRFLQGAPIDKAAWLTGTSQILRLHPEEVVFFGDTVEDLQAAERAGCAFVGVRESALAGEQRVDCYIENFEGLA
jgi:phosphoglycolate phosphatase-like HAD superfamily hydrolase